jgi:hypothetical protein
MRDSGSKTVNSPWSFRLKMEIYSLICVGSDGASTVIRIGYTSCILKYLREHSYYEVEWYRGRF